MKRQLRYFIKWGGKQIEQCIYSGEKHVYILIYEHTKKGIYESITYEDWEL